MRLILRQEADKEIEFHFDSEIVFQVYDDTLIMTTTVYTKQGPISGSRHFTKHNLDNVTELVPKSSRRASTGGPQIRSRRCSVSPALNISRRGMRNVSPHPFIRRASSEILIEEHNLIQNNCGNHSRTSGTQEYRKPSIEISLHE